MRLGRAAGAPALPMQPLNGETCPCHSVSNSAHLPLLHCLPRDPRCACKLLKRWLQPPPPTRRTVQRRVAPSAPPAKVIARSISCTAQQQPGEPPLPTCAGRPRRLALLSASVAPAAAREAMATPRWGWHWLAGGGGGWRLPPPVRHRRSRPAFPSPLTAAAAASTWRAHGRRPRRQMSRSGRTRAWCCPRCPPRTTSRRTRRSALVAVVLCACRCCCLTPAPLLLPPCCLLPCCARAT